MNPSPADDRADPDRARGGVAAACRDGNARWKAERPAGTGRILPPPRSRGAPPAARRDRSRWPGTGGPTSVARPRHTRTCPRHRKGRSRNGHAGGSRYNPWAGGPGDPGVGLRLMPRQPQELRRREPGHGRRARDLSGIGRGGEHVGAFGGRPRVVPQDHGADRRVPVRVQQDRAMHLPRQADGADPSRAARGRACRPPCRSPATSAAILFAGAVERVRDIEGGEAVAATSPAGRRRQTFTAEVPRSMPRCMAQVLPVAPADPPRPRPGPCGVPQRVAAAA
jgi:hypothetical protein